MGCSRLCRLLLIFLTVWGVTLGVGGQTSDSSSAPDANTDSVQVDPDQEYVILPATVSDPLEPFNRAIWSFNRGLLTGVVKPTGKVYRFIVIKPLRTGIYNVARNVTYPGRLINNLLQGKWTGARDETYRFFGNTLVGAGGLFDVATEWGIPKSDADFGLTFGHWGWDPNFFLMLPVIGPSNDRDAVGLAADTAADPLGYIRPYDFQWNRPLTYVSPYGYFNLGVRYSQLTESVDQYVRLARAEKDPYANLKYAWTFARQARDLDIQSPQNQDPALLETLQFVSFGVQNTKFPERGRTHSVVIPTTGRKLKFTYWLQPGPAPVVYLLPGLGGHRLADAMLGLAELVYQNGFSAVCLSSVFNYEFMENASTAAVPAYPPVDVRDLSVALTQIHHHLEAKHPHRMGNRALLGYSMGAFHSLFGAANLGSTNSSSFLSFDRYVAINSPVRLLYGMSQLDEFYRTPLSWNSQDREEHIENTLLKAAMVVQQTQTPKSVLPFDVIESKFLIGLSFRFILRDVIFSSQQRTNLGVLLHPIKKWRREPVYQEIFQYSYRNYFEKFVIPYYQARGIDLTDRDTLEQINDLRSYTDQLSFNPKVRLIQNLNDFLLSDQDVAWLKASFSPNQLTFFSQGGHLGNLGHPEMQKAILTALEGLSPSPSPSPRK